MKLGREIVHLDIIAFRILSIPRRPSLSCLHATPDCRGRQHPRYPVAEETLDQHVMSLREQLGFFRDYIQAVPYIGYRFKA